MGWSGSISYPSCLLESSISHGFQTTIRHWKKLTNLLKKIVTMREIFLQHSKENLSVCRRCFLRGTYFVSAYPVDPQCCLLKVLQTFSRQHWRWSRSSFCPVSSCNICISSASSVHRHTRARSMLGHLMQMQQSWILAYLPGWPSDLQYRYKTAWWQLFPWGP